MPSEHSQKPTESAPNPPRAATAVREISHISTRRGLPHEIFKFEKIMTIKHFSKIIRTDSRKIDYTLIGTQAEQKKFIGNAVEVNMARVLCENLCSKL